MALTRVKKNFMLIPKLVKSRFRYFKKNWYPMASQCYKRQGKTIFGGSSMHCGKSESY